MNRDLLVRSALAGVFVAGVTIGSSALAQDKGMEKCWGVAKAGQNDCGSKAGLHDCAGKSKADNDKGEWKYVAAGTCKTMGGMSMDDAKMGMKKS